ncbi:hypothetical protein HTZ84_05295 [Haloterrigena sp. SYSU A558-1]|uniref:Uncharacterized protein n=1 Tax=Haloterrigena gelatinilytica TaxID=2741724 RepID=A0ABX2LF40_9EURY|nr:hypothetical protein [Haloterrigena gelatinilytica]NUC71729.1 hypothetical protein [Haloterrigena gelatinilytica]
MTTQTNRETFSDLEHREQALAGVRDAIAALQGVPATALDAEKHETLLEAADDLQSLERALQNEVEQIQGDSADE